MAVSGGGAALEAPLAAQFPDEEQRLGYEDGVEMISAGEGPAGVVAEVGGCASL